MSLRKGPLTNGYRILQIVRGGKVLQMDKLAFIHIVSWPVLKVQSLITHVYIDEGH